MDLVTIGKITGTHHLKGAVKANISLSDPSILIGERVLVEKPNGEKKILSVKKLSNLVADKVVIEFEEITNKTEGNLLAGGFVKINRDILGMSEDEYLLEDLLGMTVVTTDNENIGKVTDVFDTAAHDIIVAEDENTETLIPNIEHFIKDIDFDKKEILVELLDGMRNPKGAKYKNDESDEDDFEEIEEMEEEE